MEGMDVRDKKRGTKKGRSVGEKMEEGEWAGETGRRLNGSTSGQEKRGKR